MYVTMVAGIFDPVTSKVKIVNAGHLPGLVFNNNSLENEYPASGPPLGVLQDIQYCTTEFVLGRHSLYLYTDGLLEARLSNKLRLQRDGLLALLVKYKKMLPTERLQLIIADIRERSLGFDDDLTILLIEA
jgi:sigma-B regulation protein RsbU (phosphoserine phosphatase)